MWTSGSLFTFHFLLFTFTFHFHGQTHQSFKRSATDDAALKFVAAGAGPVGLEADCASISVPNKRVDLTLPVDAHLAKRPPRGCVLAQHIAILRVDVRDARGGQ